MNSSILFNQQPTQVVSKPARAIRPDDLLVVLRSLADDIAAIKAKRPWNGAA